MSASGQTRLAADIGGTFTDIVIERGERRWTRKVLTTPRAPELGLMEGALGLLEEAGLKASDLDVLVHGTTLATNAVIERKGAKTALVATEGFRDTLEIADESRYDQYDVFLEKPKPLVPRALRFVVPERVDVKGRVRLALDEAATAALVPQLQAAGIESLAVSLMHSYVEPSHERRVRDILSAAMPSLAISLSSDVCPEVREYERTSTTVCNAYVQPLMAGYLGRLRSALEKAGFRGAFYMITSGGGLTTLDTAARFPIRLVESGPAGGAIFASWLAGLLGEKKLLSFDMGGTTAKICLIDDGQPQTSRSFEVDRTSRFRKGSGFPLRIPVIEMVEIGAGGGSIARVDQMNRIVVGPESAGSEPGPASYGRGGAHPAVTDADVALGRIDPETFAAGKIPLSRDRANAALDGAIGSKLALSTEMAAYGVAEMVDENMANAARVHAVERGKAAADYTLVAFGGAAPLHAARLAEKLGLARLIVPPNAGVGSAVGFLRAPVAFEVVRSRYARLDQFDAEAINATLADMSREALETVRAGAGDLKVVEKRLAYMRYAGQGHEIVVPIPLRPLTGADAQTLRENYESEYEALFARIIPNAAIEVLSWAVVATTEVPVPGVVRAPASRSAAAPSGKRRLYDPATRDWIEAPVYRRESLAPGATISGPAVVAEDETSTYISPRFDAMLDGAGCIVLSRTGR